MILRVYAFELHYVRHLLSRQRPICLVFLLLSLSLSLSHTHTHTASSNAELKQLILVTKPQAMQN
jgi:hypothetical protein